MTQQCVTPNGLSIKNIEKLLTLDPERSVTYKRSMNTWRDLIKTWGGPHQFSRDIGVGEGAARMMYQRNKVNSAYWSVIVARAPVAGVRGVTLELLASLQSGHANKPGRRDDRFRRPGPAQIMQA